MTRKNCSPSFVTVMSLEGEKWGGTHELRVNFIVCAYVLYTVYRIIGSSNNNNKRLSSSSTGHMRIVYEKSKVAGLHFCDESKTW